MAARSVLKLFSKTCSFTSATSPISTLTVENRYKCRIAKRSRSCSQPCNHSLKDQVKGKNLQIRKISRSLQNLRDNRFRVIEDENYEQIEDEPRIRFNEQTAREFKEKPAIEEKNEEGNPIYEITDGYRSQENFYDVYNFMKSIEREKAIKLFPHLQPSNIKPYGSNENLYFLPIYKKKPKIVFPVVNTTPDLIRADQSRGHSSHEEASSSLQDTRSIRVSEKRSGIDINRKRYSTSSLTARKFTPKISKENTSPKLTLGANFLRKSSSLMLKRKKKPVHNSVETSEVYRRISTDNEVKRKSTESFIKCDSRQGSFSDFVSMKRHYNTVSENPEKCEEYVTVKLGELQEECRRQKKCKPKKMSFGKLPKMQIPDCPCIEPSTLKPSKPLKRLKKRLTLEPPKICIKETDCITPRADEGLVITPKKLPELIPGECPCIDMPMNVGEPLKRLVPKPVEEPKRVCPVECPMKGNVRPRPKVEKKKLPPLPPSDCPCVEPEPPSKLTKMKRLKMRYVPKEKERICPPPIECPPRADDGLLVTPKKLPELIPEDCPCVELAMKEGEPLKRLVPKPVEEPKRVCPVECPMKGNVRPRPKVEKKKLPPLPPSDCPCLEPEPPSKLTKMKRLKMRHVPKEKERICPPPIECPPRADDGLVVSPKKLPELIPEDCPCVEMALNEGEPLKRLVPKPVEEPKRVCPTECPMKGNVRPRPKVERKTLPPLPPADCPCVEPEPPEDVPPLKKLKKRPVVERKEVCIDEEECIIPRADDDMPVKVKKLPKLEMSDCPCVEPPPPDLKPPLPRLKKKHVEEKPKICPKVDDCEDIPRADEDDWMYWKRVEVNCEPTKTSKRSFSTRMGHYHQSFGTKRFFSTTFEPESDLFHLKYDVANLHTDQLKGKSYNIIIDIKPSAPLILTQTPIQPTEHSIETNFNLKRCKSEPIDCVTFIICKNNDLKNTVSKSGLVKDGADGSTSTLFSTINRFVSTCSSLYAKDDSHLQPKNPLLKEREHFMETFPNEETINESRKKSRLYYRTRKDEMEKECRDVEEVIGTADCDDSTEKKEDVCQCSPVIEECEQPQEKLSLWQRIVNFFKARPDCPSPEEFKKMRLREEAEKAASKAGLCLYDPKEMLKKNEKDMPKVITAGTCKEETKKC